MSPSSVVAERFRLYWLRVGAVVVSSRVFAFGSGRVETGYVCVCVCLRLAVVHGIV